MSTETSGRGGGEEQMEAPLMNDRATDTEDPLWEATVAAHAPEGDRLRGEPPSIAGSNSVQVQITPTDYLCIIRVRAADIAEANRQVLGRWAHTIEHHDLPAWPATAFILHQCQPADLTRPTPP